MLPAPSLGKRSIKVPNVKLIRPYLPFARARDRTSIKMRGTESRFVTGPSNTLFAGGYVIIFQPGTFTSCDSEEVKHKYSVYSLVVHYSSGHDDPWTYFFIGVHHVAREVQDGRVLGVVGDS